MSGCLYRGRKSNRYLAIDLLYPSPYFKSASAAYKFYVASEVGTSMQVSVESGRLLLDNAAVTPGAYGSPAYFVLGNRLWVFNWGSYVLSKSQAVHLAQLVANRLG
jgi:hypothetical protein